MGSWKAEGQPGQPHAGLGTTIQPSCDGSTRPGQVELCSQVLKAAFIKENRTSKGTADPLPWPTSKIGQMNHIWEGLGRMNPTGRHKLPHGADPGHGAALGKLLPGKPRPALPSPHPWSLPMLLQLFKRVPSCPQGGKKAGELILVGFAASRDKAGSGATKAPPRGCGRRSPLCHLRPTRTGLWDPQVWPLPVTPHSPCWACGLRGSCSPKRRPGA